MPYSKLYKRTEAIAEVKREQGQRKHVYPRLIDRGKLDKNKANHQFLRLECVQIVLEGMTNEQFRHFYKAGIAARNKPAPVQQTMELETPKETEED